MVVSDRLGLVRSGRRPTSYGTGHPREAAIMTNLQLYLLLAPFVLVGLGGLAYWWTGLQH
jgi:hypothetical protein